MGTRLAPDSKGNKINIFKQHNVGRAWGYFTQVAQQGGIVFQIVTLCIQIATLASVLQMRGIMIPMWLIGVISFGIIVTAGMIIFKIGNPSYFSAWSEQFYKFDNPLRRDIEEIKERLANIEDNHHEEKAKEKVESASKTL